MSADPRALIERTIARTRSNALQQLAIGVAGSVALPLLWGGFRTIVIVLIAFNLFIAFFLARRVLRLRGPAGRALLDAPGDITEIASWPRKLPANRMPVMIDIKTRSGDTCSLLLDQKQPQAIADLLGALQRRSPEAALLIPKLSVA